MKEFLARRRGEVGKPLPPRLTQAGRGTDALGFMPICRTSSLAPCAVPSWMIIQPLEQGTAVGRESLDRTSFNRVAGEMIAGVILLAFPPAISLISSPACLLRATPPFDTSRLASFFI